MEPDEKEKYLTRLTGVLEECLAGGKKHAVLIVSNDETDMLSIYSINAQEPQLKPLVDSAQLILDSQYNPEKHTIN